MNADNDDFSVVPKEKGQIAQSILLYEMSLPAGLSLTDKINSQKDSIRLGLRWRARSSSEVNQIVPQIENKMKEMNLNGYVGGKTPIFVKISDNIITTFFISVFSTIIFIFFLIKLLISIFKNWIHVTFTKLYTTGNWCSTYVYA